MLKYKAMCIVAGKALLWILGSLIGFSAMWFSITTWGLGMFVMGVVCLVGLGVIAIPLMDIYEAELQNLIREDNYQKCILENQLKSTITNIVQKELAKKKKK